MTNTRMTTLLAALPGATALACPRFAQTAEGRPGEGQACEALTALIAREDRLRDEWVTLTNTLIEADDEAQCLARFDQAATELAALDARAAAGTTGTESADTADTTAERTTPRGPRPPRRLRPRSP